jgi:signal transduction histidine kinase/CheY-like chemotaxis protein
LGCEQPRAAWQLSAWREYIFSDDLDLFTTQLAVAKLIGSFAVECRIKRADGALRWVALAGALRIDAASKRRLLAGVIVDITDSHPNEPRKTLQSRSDFADSIFISQMNHEIRTLLHAIQGFNFLLQKSTLTPGQNEYVGKIDASAQMLLSTLDAIADYSKIEIGAFAFDSIDFRLDYALEEVCSQLAAMCDSKSVHLSLVIAPDVPLSLRGDPRRLRQIVLSLAGYALSTMRGGEITLSVLTLRNNDGDGAASDRETLLYFSLCNSGAGLSAERAERAFEIFHCSNRAPRTRGGLEIGVAVSKRLIELMGGTLSVSSDIGKGSEFNFNLHLAQSKSNSERVAPALPADKAIADVRVLLADDDVLNLLIGRAVLEHLGIHCIDTATNGLEAVDLVEKNGGDYYQMILMDIQMPVLDGYVAAREIRRCPGAENIAIVAMTADVAAERENCFIAGMNEFTTKPIRIQQLADIIARRLGVEIIER